MNIIPLDARPPQVYASGRKCRVCLVPLSRYNESDCCSIHRPSPDWHYCGYDVVVCANCGEAIIMQFRGGHKVPSKSCRYCGAKR